MLKVKKISLLILVFIFSFSLNILNSQYIYQKKNRTNKESSRLPKIIHSSYTPINGFVPDVETAIRIAEAIWRPIYGDRINHQRPFKAILNKKGNWEVRGTLPCEGQVGCRGGTAYAEIRKTDCKIIKVLHGK